MSTDQNFSHDDVFGDLLRTEFSADEAAQYLEISAASLEQLAQAGKLAPARIDGQVQFFSALDLKVFKAAASR